MTIGDGLFWSVVVICLTVSGTRLLVAFIAYVREWP